MAASNNTYSAPKKRKEKEDLATKAIQKPDQKEINKMYTKAQPKKKSKSKDRESMLKFGMPLGDPKYSKKGMPGLQNPNIVDSDEDIKELVDITTQRKKARQQMGALELREE